MKTLKPFLTALFVLLISTQAFAMTASYDQKISMGGKAIATIKVSTMDKFMKAESDFGGMKSVMLRNDKGVYSYLPEQKVATKIPAELDRPNLTRDIPRYLEFLKENGGEKIGSEKIGSYDCDVYSFTEPNIKKPSKAWVWKEKSFPIKIEVQAPEGTTIVELENINLNAKFQVSDFDLPGDVRIMNFPPNPSSAAAAAVPAEKKV